MTNQLTSGGNVFDGNGNPTTYSGKAATYDPENRLTSFGALETNTYRADGLRASKTTSAGTTYFLYDHGEPIIELSASGAVTALHEFAPDGLVARQSWGTTSEYNPDSALPHFPSAGPRGFDPSRLADASRLRTARGPRDLRHFPCRRDLRYP